MTTGATFLYGCLGGFFAAGFVYVVPVATRAASGRRINFTAQRVAAISFLLLFLTAAAGVVALMFDDLTRAQAITIGFASQTMVKGIGSAARDWFPPNPTAPK